MAEQLGDLTRTHTCGALRPDDVGADVVLLGWVHRVRDLGGLLFIDVRDRHGITQIVFAFRFRSPSPDHSSANRTSPDHSSAISSS